MAWAPIFTASGVPTTGGDNTTGCTLFVAQCALFGTFDPGAPTDNYSNTWTGVTAQGLGGTDLRTRCWYVINPTNGAGHTFTAPATGGGASPSIMVRGYSGIEAQGFIAQAGSGGTATSRATGAVVPLEDDCLVVSFMSNNTASAPSASGLSNLTTLTYSAGVNYGMSVADVSTGASTNSTWSWGGASVKSATSILAFYPITPVNLLDDLVSAWELDEASGNAIDSHGSNDLTETSGTIGTGTGLVHSTARDFEAGDTEYFEIADNASVNTSGFNVSFEAWIKPESLPSGADFVSKWGSAGNQEFIFGITSTTNARMLISKDGTANFSASVTGIATGAWIHVVGRYDTARGLMITLNLTSAFTAVTGNTFDGNRAFTIGGRSDGTSLFDGLMGPVRFAKRSWTWSEILALYNAGAGLDYSSFTGSGGGPSAGAIRRRRILLRRAG